MTVKYLSLGIILDDIVFPDGRTQMGVLGGGGPQTVWGMAVAAENAQEVGLVSGVGADFDLATLEPLAVMGIDLAGVYVTGEPTARAWQLLETDGRRTHVWRVDPATSDRQTHPDWAVIHDIYPEVTVAHWGIHPEDPYLAWCAPLRSKGALVSIEPFKGLNAPLVDDDLHTLLSQCDIYSPNWREAISIFGTTNKAALLRRARDHGGMILALRKSADGAEVWDLRAREGFSVPAAPVRAVIDPVGAGDAFCGALAVTWHETGSLAEAAVQAAAAASYLVEQVGLPPTPPTASSLYTRTEAVRAGLTRLVW